MKNGSVTAAAAKKKYNKNNNDNIITVINIFTADPHEHKYIHFRFISVIFTHDCVSEKKKEWRSCESNNRPHNLTALMIATNNQNNNNNNNII